MLKTGAIFTDAHFFLSLLSKPLTPDFSLKDFSESHILFFLDRGFFSCFSYALHKTQLFTPPQWQIYTRVSIQGPEHCDDSEQGSYTELLLMRVYYSWFHISSYLPQLFCRCLSSQALTFHLNCRRIQFLSQGVWLSLDLCDCHWIDLDCQELRRFECWENHEDSNCGTARINTKSYLAKRNNLAIADIHLVGGLLWDINTQMYAHVYRQISAR